MKPSISIITVTFNAESVITATLESVKRQRFSNIEYIVIDGQSNDDTLRILKNYADIIDQLVSEPDDGLYDAMNKGLALAKNEYVIFMNAGDSFYNDDTLKDVFSKESEADIYYGDAMMMNETEELGKRSDITTRAIPKTLDWRMMSKGMVVCHQSFIVRTSIAPDYILNNLSADIDWMINCLKKSKVITFTDSIISKYLLGGLSQQHHWRGLKDRYVVLRKHFGFIPNLFNHIWILIRWIYAKATKKVLID